MTIGDVLAFSGALVATGTTLWAAQVSCAVLFEKPTTRAASLLEKEPVKTLLTGVAMAVTAGVFAVVLVSQPNGLIKFVGWLMLAGLLCHSILGAAGLATLGAVRIKRMAPRLSNLATVQRAAGLMITAGFLPVFGWLFVFPVAFCFALGAGWRAMTGKKKEAPVMGEEPKALVQPVVETPQAVSVSAATEG